MWPDTLDAPSRVVFLGRTYQLMGKGRYYLASSKSNTARKGAKGLHVVVWETATNRRVPSGSLIHHKDGNTFNNHPENLELLTRSQHAKKHADAWRTPEQLAHLEQIRSKAAAWHRSPVGRAWHRKHARSQTRVRHVKSCEQCHKPFMSSRQARYCSNQCGYKARVAAGHYNKVNICQICGVEFTYTQPINPKRSPKTCSRKCGARLRLQHLD